MPKTYIQIGENPFLNKKYNIGNGSRYEIIEVKFKTLILPFAPKEVLSVIVNCSNKVFIICSLTKMIVHSGTALSQKPNKNGVCTRSVLLYENRLKGHKILANHETVIKVNH